MSSKAAQRNPLYLNSVFYKLQSTFNAVSSQCHFILCSKLYSILSHPLESPSAPLHHFQVSALYIWAFSGRNIRLGRYYKANSWTPMQWIQFSILYCNHNITLYEHIQLPYIESGHKSIKISTAYSRLTAIRNGLIRLRSVPSPLPCVISNWKCQEFNLGPSACKEDEDFIFLGTRKLKYIVRWDLDEQCNPQCWRLFTHKLWDNNSNLSD